MPPPTGLRAAWQRLAFPLAFTSLVAAFVIGGTPVGEAVGYGAYLAFWIGGGFGAILSGAVWSQKTGH